MLEKIGLPPKPAARGNEWVLDASHCQGCSSAFSFLNRKHHCRRCGGIFCGNCTQQRMTLRGQGEGPVRICEPCKKLEDAARFESRYGHRNRVSKGSSKASYGTQTDLLLKELIGTEGSPQNSGSSDSVDDNCSDIHNSQDDESTSTDGIGADKSHSRNRSMGMERMGYEGDQDSSVTPETLRVQAQEEKRQWTVLKREGKGEEAMQAFKRGRELERQAEALELSLRRSHRRAANAAIARKEKREDLGGSDRRKKTRSLASAREGQEVASDGANVIKPREGMKEAEEKDDLLSALKDLGWSNADLHDVGKKQSKNKSVESELAELAAAAHPSEGTSTTSGADGGGGISSMQVLAHKRKALALKREGKMAEAKEELKKAKTIERQLEEQEIGGGEESDDELAVLIRGLEKESMTGSRGAVIVDMVPPDDLFNFEHEDDDVGMEVTDTDMNDPEMVAALRSMGWEEEAAAMEKFNVSNDSGKHTASIGNRVALMSKQYDSTLLSSTGHIQMQEPTSEGLDHLQNVEACLNDNTEPVHVSEEDMEDPYFLSALKAMGFAEEEPTKLMQPVLNAVCPKPFEKTNLKQQILFLKKEALALKRAGKVEEAKEELRQAKRLEKELQELQSQHMEEEDDVLAASIGQDISMKNVEEMPLQSGRFPIAEETKVDNVEVTEEDMGDPELAKALRSLGWQDDDMIGENVHTEKLPKGAASKLTKKSAVVASSSDPLKTRLGLQKELLGLKRAALKLKRGGKLEEAEEELKKARVLERQMEELETAELAPKRGQETEKRKEDELANSEKDIDEVTEDDMEDPTMLAALQGLGWIENEKQDEMISRTVVAKTSSLPIDSATPYTDGTRKSSSMNKAREGPAIQSVQKGGAKRLNFGKEKSNEAVIPSSKGTYIDGFHAEYGETGVPTDLGHPLVDHETENASAKTNAAYPVAVGMTDLLTGDAWGPVGAEVRRGNVVVEDLMDPSLMDTLQSLGIEVPSTTPKQKKVREGIDAKVNEGGMLHHKERDNETITSSKTPMEEGHWMEKDVHVISSDTAREIPEAVESVITVDPSSVQSLQQEILAYKRKALALKHEGRPVEAKEQLRQAKMIEKKLALQESQPPKPAEVGQSAAMADVHGSTTSMPKVGPKDASSVVSPAPKTASAQKDDRSLRPDAGIYDATTAVTNIVAPRTPAQKHTAGKDRLKLQRESLAHKRKALALRREGKMEEAEAEFELAKSLEKQMEELGGGDGGFGAMPTGLVIGHQEKDDAGSVDDLFDPQLLAALKGLGWKETDILGQNTPQVGQGVKEKISGESSRKSELASGTKPSQHEDRHQLEEKIKSEKVRAVQLKRSGRQSEAVDVLRGAKQLEKQLQLMDSQ